MFYLFLVAKGVFSVRNRPEFTGHSTFGVTGAREPLSDRLIFNIGVKEFKLLPIQMNRRQRLINGPNPISTDYTLDCQQTPFLTVIETSNLLECYHSRVQQRTIYQTFN